MRPFTISSLLLALLFFFSSSYLAASSVATGAPPPLPSNDDNDHLITVACNWTWYWPEAKSQYNACVALLKSLTGSQPATLPGLAIISTKYAVERLKANINYTRELLRDGAGGKTMKRLLNSCLWQFDDSLGAMAEAIKAITEARYDDAAPCLSAVLDDIDPGCNADFFEAKVDNPLFARNQEVLDIVSVGATICFNIPEGHP